MLAACMMLDHVGHGALATRLREGIWGTLREEKIMTRDLGGAAGTEEFANAIIRRMT